MKTSELLALDLRCDDAGQRNKNLLLLKKALIQIPGIRYSNSPFVDLGSMENVLHDMLSPVSDYGIRECPIHSIYMNNKFAYYTIGFIMTGLKDSQKTIQAHTLYELFAKSVIYVYSITKKRR